MYILFFSFLSFFFYPFKGNEIRDLTGEGEISEQTSSALKMYRLHVPVCYCPKATHSPAALCVFGNSPASQGFGL